MVGILEEKCVKKDEKEKKHIHAIFMENNQKPKQTTEKKKRRRKRKDFFSR